MLRGLVLLSFSRNLKFRLAAVRSVVNVLKKQVVSQSRSQGRSGLRVRTWEAVKATARHQLDAHGARYK